MTETGHAHIAVRHDTVWVDGPIHVVDFGGEGRPVVLVHGLGSSHAIWLRAGALLAHHARVIALDMPGFGYSPLGGRTGAVDDQARILAGVVDDVVGCPAGVVGNSMGGVVAMLAARHHAGSVRAVVLVNPGLRRPHGVHLERAVLRRFGAIVLPVIGERYLDRHWEDLGPAGVVKASLELSCVDPDRVPAEVEAALVEVVGHVLRAPGARRAYLEATRSLVRFAGSQRQHRRLVMGFDQPTLLVAGEQDRLVPVEAAMAVAAERPDWDLVTLPGVGHTPQLESAEELVATVTGWWSRRLGARRHEERLDDGR